MPAVLLRGGVSGHWPETLLRWIKDGDTLRARLTQVPPLNPNELLAAELGLRDCQEVASTNNKVFLAEARFRALIQMATGSSKTFTAINQLFRRLKFLQLRSRIGWSLSNLIALLRLNLFVHRYLWAWLDTHFDGPPIRPRSSNPRSTWLELDSILHPQPNLKA